MENEASSELFALLISIGDRSPEVWLTPVSGLVAARAAMDPIHIISGVAKIVDSEPWKIRYILRMIPVERVVDSKLDSIRDAVAQMAERIQKDETFRVTVEKRMTSLSQSIIIQAAAEVVKRKVNLDHPDYVVLVEVIQDLAGISILKPEQILSVVKKKRGD